MNNIAPVRCHPSVVARFIGLSVALGLFLASMPAKAHAHYLWLENDSGTYKAFFGGYLEVKEKSGGRLDEFTGLEVWTLEPKAAQPKKASWAKKEDHFLIQGTASARTILAQDLGQPVKDFRKYDIGIVKPAFYARHQEASAEGQKPVLDLDVLPIEGEDKSFRVYFKKQPLPEAKVVVTAPNNWNQEFKSDKEGKVKIETPWPGQYVLDIIYKEKQPGTYQGKEFEATRHRLTYVLLKP